MAFFRNLRYGGGLKNLAVGTVRALRGLRHTGTAESTRYAMRNVFNSQLRRVERDPSLAPHGIEPHKAALFYTMCVRYESSGIDAEPILHRIWVEVAPFMELDPETAGEALAEYIIWLEGAYEPKIEWLRSRVNEGAAKGEKNQYTREFLARGRENNFPWVQLLEED